MDFRRLPWRGRGARKSCGHYVLQVSLARVDHVVNELRPRRNAGARIVLTGGRGPDRVACGSVMAICDSEILAEQAEFPKLVGDVFADVGDGAIGAHNDLCLIVFVGCLRHRETPLMIPGHDPATFSLAGVRKLYGSAGFQLFKRGIPELQVQDFAFAR